MRSFQSENKSRERSQDGLQREDGAEGKETRQEGTGP